MKTNENFKLLRYNTGNDKEVFLSFKNKFDYLIFNATIVAYSRSAISDLVSIYQNNYIIDPQTHIFQHEISAIQSKLTGKIKSSVAKYLEQMPEELANVILKEKRTVEINDINECFSKLVDCVYKFQTEFINKTIKEKEYDKYLKFADIKPEIKFLIAPYFMLKEYYEINNTIESWLKLNKNLIEEFVKINKDNKKIAAQLVLDKKVLINQDLPKFINRYYDVKGCDYVFLWIDDFSAFDAKENEVEAFFRLLKELNKIGKKVIMAYGGYDSILLCNSDVNSTRLFGVAQSIGYGESREITPVGGGLPVNKYYFLPIHRRLKMNEITNKLLKDLFTGKNKKEAADKFYDKICNCKQCKVVIKDNIDNFNKYNDSRYFTSRNTTRTTPTREANIISAKHFIYCKLKEWSDIQNRRFASLKKEFLDNCEKYDRNLKEKVGVWFKYVK